MRTEPITKKQVNLLRKKLSGTQKNINWNKIDYDKGRGVINKKKYCLWTTDGSRIDISVSGKGITVSKSERNDL